MDPLDDVPAQAVVVIETPRFSHVKRRDDGAIAFVSPLPSPFNYGSVPDTRSGDGDRIDAIVLGRRLPRDTRVELPVVAVVDFVDAGQRDPKWVCAPHALRPRDRLALELFFRCYVLAKRAFNRARGAQGATHYGGVRDLRR